MLTLADYEKQARIIATTFVASKGTSSINDQVTKIATDMQLNPDGVRTLVRLANVCTFEGLMTKAAADEAEDRMIEFETGDPEKVLAFLHDEVKIAHAQIREANHYNRDIDFYSDIPSPVPSEKIASVATNQPPKNRRKSPAEIKLQFSKARNKLAEAKKQAQVEWFLCMEKAAAYLTSIDSRVTFRVGVEKVATAEYTDKIEPELRMLQRLTGEKNNVPLYGGEKTAEVIARHVPLPDSSQENRQPILDKIKQAQQYRGKARLCQGAIAWIDRNISRGN